MLGMRAPAVRWLPAAAVLLAAAVMLTPGGRGVVTVISGVLLLLLALGFSPLFFPRTRDVAAAEAEADRRGVPTIFWRPGCSYCLRMRIALGLAGNRAIWVDVSLDDEASFRVREVNNGNETVPTVFAAGEARTNPPPSWVREQLHAA